MGMEGFESYEYSVHPSFHKFEFESCGPKGRIRKEAKFNHLYGNVYNFGFGDKIEGTDKIDDKVVTNNFDMDKIFATLTKIILDFTEKFPGVTILVKGSTASRTRLYQMTIKRNWKLVEPFFNVRGYQDGFIQTFKLENNYEEIFINRRGVVI
jgi:hypothetical protein